MVLKMLILVLVPRSDDLQTFFSCWKAALALPMRALTSELLSSGVIYDAAQVSEALHLIQRLTFQHNGSICDRAEVSATVLVFSCTLARYFFRRFHHDLRH